MEAIQVPHTRPSRSGGRKLLSAARSVLVLTIALPWGLLVLVAWILSRLVIYLLVWLLWSPQGKDVLLVSSDSPISGDSIDARIAPLVEGRAVRLNWSERKHWSKLSLPVLVFRLLGGEGNFNPMLVLFRPLRPALFFRFFPAFQQWKHGNPLEIERLRGELIPFL